MRLSSTSSLISASAFGWATSCPISASVSTARALPDSSISGTSVRAALFSATSSSFQAAWRSRTIVARMWVTLCRE
ncbi:MAG TPA: hypothetical protein VJN18_14750 [Polyangiaceae bacterium]|nr:hypothetical protein [Polyangiaceae bacterium]